MGKSCASVLQATQLQNERRPYPGVETLERRFVRFASSKITPSRATVASSLKTFVGRISELKHTVEIAEMMVLDMFGDSTTSSQKRANELPLSVATHFLQVQQ